MLILDEIIKNFNIKGFVISHISQVEKLQKFNLEFIGNFTLNIYNNYSIKQLLDLGFSCFTPSIELNAFEISNLIKNSYLPNELIVYGKLPVINTAI